VSGAARLLRLSETDNVYIATGPLRPGDVVRVDGREFPVTERVELGHKVAARAIEAGEKIVRFGMPIGSATRPIAAGAWVHTHNLTSDYIRTFGHRGGDGHA
jgi:altronate dehydratase small subunit